MGFTAFAIEAAWPESNRIDRYVRSGVGNPEALLSGLYFWTWNTTEVLDMILGEVNDHMTCLAAFANGPNGQTPWGATCGPRSATIS